MFVKPKEGVNVRDPDSAQLAHLPAEGREVPESNYWLRRLRSGDVVRAIAPAPIAAPVASVLQVNQIPDSNVGEE